MSVAAPAWNQPADDGTGPVDSQLEFVTIAGIAYSTGLGPDPAACGPAGGAQPCVALYEGLVEAALARSHEEHHLVN